MAKAPKPETQEAKPVEKLFPVLLQKNYVPMGQFEIVGYLKPKVEAKNAAGQMVLVEPEVFVPGEMKPGPAPGVGFDNKIWAGTQIKLPLDEARGLIARKIAERADDIAA